MTTPSLGLAMGATDALTDDILAGVEAAACDLGLDTQRVADLPTAAGRDVILGVGYPDYYRWLASAMPGSRRILWLGESLPAAGEPAAFRVRRRLPMGRILDSARVAGRAMGWRTMPVRMVAWREQAAVDHDHRINLAAYRRAARAGFEVVVTSSDRAASLAERGIAARVVPYGYHPVMAGMPQDVDDRVRDIDVLIVGTAASGVPTRRARIVAATLDALGPAVRTELVEGGLYGVDRQRLLGRTRIVLNVHRLPGNFTGIRAILAAAAGAMLVSEPIDAPAPFVPGTHYLEGPADSLASMITAALADRDRRLAIARAGQRLVVEELTMATSLQRLLEPVS